MSAPWKYPDKRKTRRANDRRLRGAFLFGSLDAAALGDKIVNYTEYYTEQRRKRGRKSNLEHRDSGAAAHEIRKRNTDEKCGGDTLDHDEKRLSAAVEIAHEAEQYANEQTVDRIRFHVFRARRDDLAVV